jgi:anti-anti-sigma factor
VIERQVSTGTLRLRVGAPDGLPRLAVEGELDLSSVSALEEAVADALGGAEDGGVVELDLGGVTFMDSTGLRGLLTARQRAEAAGRRLRVVAATPAVRRVLELTHTAELFELDG